VFDIVGVQRRRQHPERRRCDAHAQANVDLVLESDEYANAVHLADAVAARNDYGISARFGDG
jgi:hypothetical protein